MHLRRNAMSLIEVTLVILVIGLLVAVAAPRFADSLRVTRLEAAAQQLAAHLDYVRSVAINEGRTTSMIFDNAAETYAADSVDWPERIGELLSVSLPDDYDPTFRLNANFDSDSTISFDFEGVPRVGATPMNRGSVLVRSGSERFRVRIATGTGETKVVRVVTKTTDPEPSEEPLSEATP